MADKVPHWAYVKMLEREESSDLDYQAMCEVCSWKGPMRTSDYRATQDADAHEITHLAAKLRQISEQGE